MRRNNEISCVAWVVSFRVLVLAADGARRGRAANGGEDDQQLKSSVLNSVQYQ